MKLSKDDLTDLRYLRGIYGWDDRDAREVMRSIEESVRSAHYYRVLAAAHRAGYEQTAENGYIRLQPWCEAQGLSDPFGPGFDLGALQAMAIEHKEAA